MTSYPVNFQYDKYDGQMFDGVAETSEEARAIMSEILTEANAEPTEAPEPRLATTECGAYGRNREDIESWWADEIAAGYCKPVKAWNGWIAEVTYWTAP